VQYHPNLYQGIVSAVVLAGGLGTRLRSVVADRPKVMAQVVGRPFIEFLFDQLIEAGIQAVVLATGYRAEQIEEAYGPRYRSLELSYSRETQQLGTGGAVKLALAEVRTPWVLVLNGDSFCDCKIGDFLAASIRVASPAAMILAHVPDAGRFGQVTLSAGGAVTSFSEKKPDAGAGLINAGIYLFKRATLEDLPAGRAHSLERELFPALVGHGLWGYQANDAGFIDIGTPESLLSAQKLFKRGAHGDA